MHLSICQRYTPERLTLLKRLQFFAYNAVKSKLVNFIPEYEKNTDVYDLLYDKIDTAIQNAKKLEHFHEETGNCTPLNLSNNPFTEIYKLIEQSLCTIPSCSFCHIQHSEGEFQPRCQCCL